VEDIGGTLSQTEVRIERWRKTIGLFLGPVASAALYLTPLPNLRPEAHLLAAVLIWVVVWWITEPVPIPITALIGVVLCVVSGAAPAPKAFAPLADPTIFLFLGSFVLAEAMAVHQLDRRFAYRIMSLGWVGDSAGRLLFTYGAIAAFVSMWISNTATTAMMLPIGVGIVRAMAQIVERERRDEHAPSHSQFGTGMMLMAAYAASAGGIGTPIGTPPNLIGIALIERTTGQKIPFFQWMALSLPCLVVMFVLLFALLSYLHRPEVSVIAGSRDYVRSQLQKLGPWTPGQRNTLIAFIVAVSLWIAPGLLAIIFGSNSTVVKTYNGRLPEAVVAVTAAALLFVLPTEWSRRTFTLNWRQAVRIDWGTLLLFGGGISLGNLMFETGLAEALGRGLLRLSGAESAAGVTLAAVVTAVIVSEATSNTASANMVVPVMISLAMAAGLNPIPPAIGATLGASWGFMLPVSTPPNAIVYGSGMIRITQMIRAGVFFDLIGVVTIWVGLQILLPLLGLD
jgi:sodium-dependent dicarboxylate transporter 2/3/5